MAGDTDVPNAGRKIPVSLSLTPKRHGVYEKGSDFTKTESSSSGTDLEKDAEIERKLLEVLESVRAAIQADGGDIVYKGIRNGVVRLQLVNCQTCLIPDMSIKEGLERVIKSRVDGVRGVETI